MAAEVMEALEWTRWPGNAVSTGTPLIVDQLDVQMPQNR